MARTTVHLIRKITIYVLALSIICIPSYGHAQDTLLGDNQTATETPQSTPPDNTISCTPTPLPVPVAEPTATPLPPKPLPAVTGIKAIRYSTSSIKITWKKVRQAVRYKVYTATEKNGQYRLAGTTKATHFRLKKLRKNTTYYIRVQACAGAESVWGDSSLSNAVSMRTKTYRRTTVFAGDSITTGLTVYRILPKIHIGGAKKVTAAIGLNTVTFRTKRVFGGKSGLGRLISYKPYRVYMMLGINELHFRRADVMISQYRELIEGIREASPKTDIVLLAVSPVTKAERAKRTGFRQIPDFNRKLKKLAGKMGCKYYNYTNFLKNNEGYLAAKYSAGDGYHWNTAGYRQFAKIIEKYDKSQDE